jgi:hypothetical protein
MGPHLPAIAHVLLSEYSFLHKLQALCGNKTQLRVAGEAINERSSESE